MINGLVQADDALKVSGGSHSTGIGVLVTETLFDAGGQRLSGGTLDTASGGTISVDAADGILIQGVAGQLTGSTGNWSAKTASVRLESYAGTVSVSGQVDAADTLVIEGRDIDILPGGRVKAWAEGSSLRLQADDTVSVIGATEALEDGWVQADVLVHLAAAEVKIDGLVEDRDSSGRVLLNAEDLVLVTGTAQSKNRIEVNAGLDAASLSLAQLTGAIAASSLSGGNVTIQGAGSLVAPNAVVVQAGGDFTVDAASSVSSGATRTLLTPVILTTQRSILVVTDFNRVAVGTIQVPVVEWVATTITEQVGTAKVQVGTKNYTMDVTLTQTGYYKAQGGDFREILTEGTDYKNDEVDWSGIAGKLGILDIEVPPGDSKNAAYRAFDQLNDDQRKVVLSHLGYMPLFNFSYANAAVHQTYNGTPSVQPWTPDWAGAGEVIYRVDVDGWRDKFIRMPKGAQADVLRVVSQGEPVYLSGDTTPDGNEDGTWVAAGEDPTGELIAQFKDTANAASHGERSEGW